MNEIIELDEHVKKLERQYEHRSFTFLEQIGFVWSFISAIATVGIAIFVGSFIGSYFNGNVDVLLNSYGLLFIICLCIAIPHWFIMGYFIYMALKSKNNNIVNGV